MPHTPAARHHRAFQGTNLVLQPAGQNWNAGPGSKEGSGGVAQSNRG